VPANDESADWQERPIRTHWEDGGEGGDSNSSQVLILKDLRCFKFLRIRRILCFAAMNAPIAPSEECA